MSVAEYGTLKAAQLSIHFSPHCLRHTFASLLLQQGESPAYVQRQLGHASIQLTVDTYAKWLPLGNKAAVNQLDEESGSKVVAKKTTGTPAVTEVPVKYDRSRTSVYSPGELRIKSDLQSISTEVYDDARLEDLYTWD